MHVYQSPSAWPSPSHAVADLSPCTSLTQLNLSRCSSLEASFDDLPHFAHLSKLSLRGMRQVCGTLSDLSSRCPNLKDLSIAMCPNVKGHLSDLAQCSSGMVKLLLDGSDGIDGSLTDLTAGCPELEILSLANCGAITGKIGGAEGLTITDDTQLNSRPMRSLRSLSVESCDHVTGGSPDLSYHPSS
jgi:hypothetical protein